MKRAVLTLVLAAFVVTSGRAQTPPNLSGTWRPQNPMAGQANPFEFTITQTADSVTIRTPLSNPDTVTLNLNAETRTPISSGQRGSRRRHGNVHCLALGGRQTRGEYGAHSAAPAERGTWGGRPIRSAATS